MTIFDQERTNHNCAPVQAFSVDGMSGTATDRFEPAGVALKKLFSEKVHPL